MVRRLKLLIKDTIVYARVFSLKYAILHLWCTIDERIMLRLHRPVSYLPLKYKGRYILSWLTQQLSPVIAKYQKCESECNKDDNAPIWLCWLQGMDTAPKIVQKLTQNTLSKSHHHPVIILNEANIDNYVNIDPICKKKYEQNLISAQHYSDLIRVSLLESRGGLWLDATSFLVREIPDEVFDLPVYNVKNISSEYLHKNIVLDSSLWESYCLAGQRGSVTYSFLREAYEYYWHHYDVIIDYFLINYIDIIARKMIPACEFEYQLVPSNNYLCEILMEKMEDGLPDTYLNRHNYLSGDTWYYKLSYKSNCRLINNEKKTLYNYIINEYLR